MKPGKQAELKRNGIEIVATISGEVRMRKRGKRRKVKDEKMAEKIINQIDQTTRKIIRQMTGAEKLAEVQEIASWMDEIL